MFISAIRLHYNLNGATLTSAASDCTRRNKAFSFLSVISEAHYSIFERLGYSSEFWVLVKELPLVFTFIPTISMPTVKYPLYFRCVLNSLFVFWFCVFVWEKKNENWKVATSAALLMSLRRKRQDAISPLVPLFWVRHELEEQRWRVIASDCLSKPPLLVPSTSVVC